MGEKTHRKLLAAKEKANFNQKDKGETERGEKRG